MPEVIDISKDKGEGRKIFIEVITDGDKELIYSDWTQFKSGGFRTNGEVIEILQRVIQSIVEQLQKAQLQGRPFTGTPPWIGRNK